MNTPPRIAYVQYADPALYPPLDHSSRIFADSGWEVLFLGIGAWGAPAIHLSAHKRIKTRYLSFCPPGVRQKLHYLAFCVWVTTWIIAFRARWIYCSDLLVCPAARLLSMMPGIRIIYHEHDAPGKQEGTNSLLLSSRRVIARSAWLNILPNEHRAKQFKSDTGTTRPIRCVWNCPRRDEVSGSRDAATGGDIWLLYHGSLVPDRLPLTILEALQSLPGNVKLRVIGYETIGSTGYTEKLRNKAREIGILDRLEFLGTVPRHELLALSFASDIGLSFMPMISNDLNMQAMTGASNKAFDYMASGLALLVSNLPDWVSFFVDPGYALACDPTDATSIACGIETLVANRSLMRAMGERGRKRIEEEWNYETQFAPAYATLLGD